jgi:hypothetical protein
MLTTIGLIWERRTMPELTTSTMFLVRSQLRQQLLRAAAALADEQVEDDDALALTRNTVAAVLAAVDTIERPTLRQVA